jgi:hypothetical protein
VPQGHISITALGSMAIAVSVEGRKKGLQALHRFLRARMVMRGIEAGRDVVQMLAVDLESGKSPLADEFLDEPLRVFDGLGVPGAQVKAVPPGNILDRAILVEQQHVGMIVQKSEPGRDRQRGVPEPGLESARADVRHQARTSASPFGYLARSGSNRRSWPASHRR